MTKTSTLYVYSHEGRREGTRKGRREETREERREKKRGEKRIRGGEGIRGVMDP